MRASFWAMGISALWPHQDHLLEGSDTLLNRSKDGSKTDDGRQIRTPLVIYEFEYTRYTLKTARHTKDRLVSLSLVSCDHE